MSDVNRKVAEYENRIALMAQEIERLNGTLKKKVEENSNFENRLYQLTQEIERLNGVLKQKVDENEALRRSQSEWEYKYSQEWQSKITTYESRIRESNMDRENLENRLRQLSQENDELKRRLQELSDVNRKVAEYENRIALMAQEIERLGGSLKSKN